MANKTFAFGSIQNAPLIPAAAPIPTETITAITATMTGITGNNTKFLSAYSTGTIRIGDALDVNGRIYVVDSIISDTNVRVSQIPSTYGEGAFNTSPRLIYSVPFNETANLQPFNIVGTIMGYANQAFITTRTGRITIEQDGTTAIATENQIEITTE